MPRKPDTPDAEVLPDQDAVDVAPEPEEFLLVKGEESLTVHRSALNYYLSAGWKRA